MGILWANNKFFTRITPKFETGHQITIWVLRQNNRWLSLKVQNVVIQYPIKKSAGFHKIPNNMTLLFEWHCPPFCVLKLLSGDRSSGCWILTHLPWTKWPSFSRPLKLQNVVHFHPPFLTNDVYFPPHDRPPLLKGRHLGWPYRGVSLYSNSLSWYFD